MNSGLCLIDFAKVCCKVYKAAQTYKSERIVMAVPQSMQDPGEREYLFRCKTSKMHTLVCVLVFLIVPVYYSGFICFLNHDFSVICMKSLLLSKSVPTHNI